MATKLHAANWDAKVSLWSTMRVIIEDTDRQSKTRVIIEDTDLQSRMNSWGWGLLSSGCASILPLRKLNSFVWFQSYVPHKPAGQNQNRNSVYLVSRYIGPTGPI